MAKTNVRGGQIADGANGVNLTVDVNGLLPVANGGLNRSAQPASGRILVSNGSAYVDEEPSYQKATSVQSAMGSLSVNTDNPVPGTVISLATGDIAKVGWTARWKIAVAKTAAGTSPWSLKIKYGTLGLGGDAEIARWNSNTNTALTDRAVYELVMEVTATGASATANFNLYGFNKYGTAVTGLGELAFVPGTTTAFDTGLTNPFVHVDINPATGAVMTAMGYAEILKGSIL